MTLRSNRAGARWRRPGLTFFAYLIGYAVMRFFLT